MRYNWAAILLLICYGPAQSAGKSTSPEETDRFQWRSALQQSALFLAIEHTYRFADQPYTRQHLRGPFLRDYLDSICGIRGWDDGDSFLANYVGHPMQGAVSGYIQIQNDPQGMRREFGADHHYWKSRLKALGFSALYSTQYEIGPLGEAAWGNVGKAAGTKGAVDLIITPTLGTGLLVLEDVIDKYVILRLENKTENRWAKLLVRSALNPDRSFANLLRFRVPWHRDSRGGVGFK